MRYIYVIINPDTQTKVGEGRAHFINKRTIADAIRRKVGSNYGKGRTLINQRYEHVWELLDRWSHRVLYQVIITENKHAEKA